MSKIINVSNRKLNFFRKQTLDEHEDIVIAVRCEFKKEKLKFSRGFLVCTYGTNYIYESQFFGSPIHAFNFHFLNCIKIHIFKDKISLIFEDNNIEIKTRNIKEVTFLMLKIFSEMTWNCDSVDFMKIQTDIELPDYTVSSRAANSLINRALFLSHFYETQGHQLFTVDYFKKIEDKPTNLLVLSKRFHPGNFAAPFGHAIAWEASVSTLCMQGFATADFSTFFDIVLENSQKIERVAFADYNDEIPKFNLENVTSTIVSRYWFVRSAAELIVSFFSAARYLQCTMKEILISHCNFEPKEFSDLVKKISKSHSACEVKKLFITKLGMEVFPLNDFVYLASIAQSLETLTIADVNVDGSALLNAISCSSTRVRHIKLTKISFDNAIPQGICPPHTLLALNVSYCKFSAIAFKSLLEYLCSTDMTNPIIVSAQKLSIGQDAYDALATLNFNGLKPNIGEFDWSGNVIPSESMNYFFAFLFTQTRNHLLQLNEVKPKNKEMFLSNLSTLILSVSLLGLDIAGKYPQNIFIPFIQSLRSASFIRRLKIKNISGGDEGIDAYQNLIESLPELTELGGDGFHPNSLSKLIRFWKAVRDHPKVNSCDLPQEDLGFLGMKPNMLTQDMKDLFNELLKNRPRLSTTMQRLEFMTIQAQKAEEAEDEGFTTTEADTSRIFQDSTTIVLSDDDGDFDSNIFKTNDSTMHQQDEDEFFYNSRYFGS